MKLLVIGACNIDIVGISEKPLKAHDSNIGHVRLSLGGVATNLATNLYRLGQPMAFVTLIGTDALANFQKDALDHIGFDYSHSFKKTVASSLYLAIHDTDKDLATAINDMHPFETLTVADFQPLHDYIETFDALVMDTNLAKDTLEYLIHTFRNKRIYVDGVSQQKVKRIEAVLADIDLLKINQYELNSLLNTKNCDIITGVGQLLESGLKQVLVSSSDGPIIYNLGKAIQTTLPMEKTQIQSTIGAGDALFAGTVYQLMQNAPMTQAVDFGKRAAAMTLDIEEACHPGLGTLNNL